MKTNALIIKLFLVSILFMMANGLKAVDRNEVKPFDKGIANGQAVADNTNLKTITKELTFKEKIKIIKEIRKETKKAKKAKAGSTPMIILYILAIILPPVAVGLYTNWGEPTLWNLLFTICFWIPGIVHAFYILLK